MNKKDSYSIGINNGYSIAECNINDYEFNNEDDKEKFISEMAEYESDGFRQYSPFEFYAKEFNESRYPDSVWESYDNGVYMGIKKSLREYLRDNKIRIKKS